MSRFPIKNNTAFSKDEADRFNAHNPVGAKVTVRLDSGVPFETLIASPAYTLDARAVVKVNGFSHAWPLQRVRPGWDDHLAVGPL